eukprot:TRINITY_DN48623_c0_g1_i1.p1 TRINITY_DN48623_c0_g1~~TRINITY_DN48623_c0_g1_i1.p1  ORF type:complete len:215 (+),score=36.22 TRINITY_DN48623_c0_g1_i1:68-712(+)
MVANRQPIVVHGHSCTVHRHSSMACAFVTYASEFTREIVFNFAKDPVAQKLLAEIDSTVFVERRVDKTSGISYSKDIFVAWKGSNKTTVDAHIISEVFDSLFLQVADLVSMSSSAPQPLELPTCKLSRLRSDAPEFQPSKLGKMVSEIQFHTSDFDFLPSNAHTVSEFAFAVNSAPSREGKPLAYSPISNLPPRRLVHSLLNTCDENLDYPQWL